MVYTGITSLGNCNLFDIPPCQNMVQGHYIVGTTYKSRLMHSRCKNTWPRQHSPNGLPQAPSNKFSLASRQRPWCQSMQRQLPSTNIRWASHKLNNLLTFLLQCDSRPNEWGTQWDSNSLMRFAGLACNW